MLLAAVCNLIHYLRDAQDKECAITKDDEMALYARKRHKEWNLSRKCCTGAHGNASELLLNTRRNGEADQACFRMVILKFKMCKRVVKKKELEELREWRWSRGNLTSPNLTTRLRMDAL